MKVLISVFVFVLSVSAAESEWVHPGADGKLVYKTTAKGDRIMDFSQAGYMGGGVAIPDIPVKATLKPTGDDDTGAIQNAITQVSSSGGAVLLAPGTFLCSDTITISASGVVLRGSGTNKTTIKLTGVPHNGITIRPERATKAAEEFRTKVATQYVASGANSFDVEDASGFAIGDTIEIRKPITESWIKFMGMDDLVRDNKAQTWLRAGNNLVHERKIAAISGKTLTVDVPLSDSLDRQYAESTVVKIKPAGRISQIGIENLRIEAPPQAISHTEKHFSAIRMNAEDSWLRNLLIEETMNSVGINGRRITAQNVIINRKAKHQGSSKPAEFAPNGTQVLLDRCAGSADNVWYVGLGSGVSGPVVLLNCNFSGDGHVEAHQRWSTGMLYDNCRVPGGGMEFRNRGEMGSGHGWAMGWGVAWNCEAKEFVIQNPPGAVNWMIGCVGENKPMPRPFGKGPSLPEGVKDSAGTHVIPASLYLAQLKERLGPQALKNIGY
ncbi:MAG TPA: glycosyl hydrolase family 28-related protein [Verrucomicrobiae bacterium]